MLPTASPAHAEVLASRLLTYGRWLDYAFYMAFGIVAFTSVDLDVGDIARSAERHKTTISSMRVKALPSAATSVISTPSSRGRSFSCVPL